MNMSNRGYTPKPHPINADNQRRAVLNEQWRRFMRAKLTDGEELTLLDAVNWFDEHLEREEYRPESGEVTRVTFRKFPVEDDGEGVSGGDVIAVFLNDAKRQTVDAAGKRHFLVSSYQHVGQHGEFDVDLLDELETPSIDEISELMDELYDVGYVNLLIE